MSEDKKLDQMKLFERLVFFLVSKPNCISHTIPDFSRAVKEGLSEIIKDAETKCSETPDGDKREFYTAISEVLRGIIQYSRNIATKAEKLSKKEKNPDLKRELLKIAEINRRVPEFSAGSFREALTTIWICWTAVHLENPNVGLSLGRLDQILYDFYKRDIDKGVIDINDAIELICCLWLKIGDHVPTIPEAGVQLFGGTGSNQAITIGGIDKKGDDAVNDLTYVMLRATELMKLRDPNLNARYYSGINPPAYLKRICEVNIKTGATPAIHNDKAVISTLTQRGETVEQARDYGVIGCVEPGSNGRFYGHTGAILLNLASILELTLFNGRHRHTGMDLKISKETGDPAAFTAFEQLKQQAGGLEQLTKQFGLESEEQIKEQIELDMKVEQILGKVCDATTQPDKDAVRDFYEQNKKRFARPEEIRVAHIVKHIDGRVDDESAYEAIKKAHEELSAGGLFEALAVKYSDCPENGGDLGYITRGRMVEEFEDVVFNLGQNQVSDIFQTRFGYHIAKVYDRKPPTIQELKDVEEQIVNELKRQMADEAVDRFVDDLKSTAKIEDV